MSITEKANNRDFKKTNYSKDTQRKTCEYFRYHKTDHIKKNCWIWKYEQKDNSNNSHNNNTNSKVSTIYDPEQLNKMLLIHKCTGKTLQSIWLIDSSANNYVTDLKDYFM